MRLPKAARPFLLIAVMALPGAARAEVPQELKACGDLAEFAPYTIALRGPDGARTGQVGGFNVDLLNQMMATEGRSVSYTLLPWKRCLAMAAKGDFDIVLDVASSPERQRHFLLSQGHYAITPGLIYRINEPVPQIRNAQEFARYRRCEILGWDYSQLGLPTSDSVSRPSGLDGAMSMMRAGRCQILYFNLELLEGLGGIDGLRKTGLDFLPLPWMKRYQLHFGVGRKLAHGRELVALLDKGIEQMRKSGESARLLARRMKATAGTSLGRP
jgi:polar amino acid transport system substrate-binding protein